MRNALTCRSLFCVFAVLFVGASCVRSAAATTEDDPCKTVLLRDVSSALGAAVTKTKHHDAGAQGASCSFRTAHFLPSAVVTALRFGSAAEATSTFHQMIAQNAQLESAKPTMLHGIGDDAAIVSSIVYTLKGSAIYTFGILPMTGSEFKSEQLAKATLPHIKP